MLGVNRVGLAKDLPHSGGSVVLDPHGVALVEGAADEDVLVADVEQSVVDDIRTSFPFLADRRAGADPRPSRPY